MLELRIDVQPKENKDRIAEMIHKSLVGYEEYKNNNILLNKDGDYITLIIGPENNNYKLVKLICRTEEVSSDENQLIIPQKLIEGNE